MVDIEEILNGERRYPSSAPASFVLESEGPANLADVEYAALERLFGGGDANEMILRLIEIIKALQAEQPNG